VSPSGCAVQHRCPQRVGRPSANPTTRSPAPAHLRMRRGGPFLGRTSARGQTLGSALRMAQTLLRTPLHDRHLALGARLVPFAGWVMCVLFADVFQEYRAVSSDGGVFDVSAL